MIGRCGRVALGELGAGRETGLLVDAHLVGTAHGLLTRLVPQREHPAEVDERVTDRRLLPIDDRGDARREVVGEHHVGELVVAVEQARRSPGRRVRA